MPTAYARCVNCTASSRIEGIAQSSGLNISEGDLDFNKDDRLTPAELVPIVFLALEALAGLLCNVIVVLVYFRKRSLLENVGNVFTVNLAVIDIILCGVALPITLVTQLLSFGSAQQANNLCFLNRGLLIFCAIASVAGTALLALDRADVSLRALKRFFVKGRTAYAIAIVWSVSVLATVAPLLLMFNYDTAASEEWQAVPVAALADKSRSRLGDVINSGDVIGLDNVTCAARCAKDLCSLNKFDLSLQIAFQVSTFVIGNIIIISVYLKILQSVQRGSNKQAKKIREQHSLKMTRDQQKKSLVLKCCGGWMKSRGEDGVGARAGGEDKDATVITTISESSPRIERANNNKTRQIVQVKQAEPSPSPKLSGVKVDDKAANGLICAAGKQEPDSGGTEEHHAEAKTDFASVALSITVVLALKRMVAAKIREKRRRTRHLRKMVVLILLTFVTCWTPFHALPVAKYLAGPDERRLCAATCSFKDTSVRGLRLETPVESGGAAWNAAFLWSLVLGVASCTINPALYSFSREKIRKDIRVVYCAKSGPRLERRARVRISAVWSSPWGRGRRASPQAPKCRRGDAVCRVNTCTDSCSSSARDVSEKLLGNNQNQQLKEQGTYSRSTFIETVENV